MEKIVLLYDATQAVISTFDADEVLRQILSILRDYFKIESSAVLLLDPETGGLRVQAHAGMDEPSIASEVPVGKGLVGSAVEGKQIVYAPRVKDDPRYIPMVPGTRSELVLPLLVRDTVIGVLDCQSAIEDAYDPETIELLKLFSAQASIAIENARLYSQERRRAAQLEAINSIARQTTSVLDLDELLDRACTDIAQSFSVDHVGMLLLEDGKLRMRAEKGRLTPIQGEGLEFPAAAGLSGRALREGRPVLENDVNQAPGYVRGFLETRSELCIPLISFGETLGVLVLESARPNAFHPGDIGPLCSVADICGIAIQNARLFQRVRQMAYMDGLTGLFNRRYFDLRVVEEIERVKRYDGRFSLILIDIDHFKEVNDDYGHLAGDEVLRQIRIIFAQSLRKADVPCRYGGEEFIIIAPHITRGQARRIAEKLRRTVAGWAFPGVNRPITISAGVAECPENGDTHQELVKAADTALYAAKQEGRNRVYTAQAPLETP